MILKMDLAETVDIKIIAAFLILIHVLILSKSIYDIFGQIFEKNTKLMDSVKIDKALIQAGNLNLSNILYKRLTLEKISSKFICQIFMKHLLILFFHCTIVIAVLVKTEHRGIFKECRGPLITSLVYSLFCLMRVSLYFCQRYDFKNQNENENLQLVIEFI